MSDYEYTMRENILLGRALFAGKPKRRPPLTVEVTHRYVTFIRPHTSTSYEPSRASYDRLVRLANSGAYVVEILDGGYGVGWQMRRKEEA